MTDEQRSSYPTRTRYGTANPERVENLLWQRGIQENWSGYHLRQHLGIELGKGQFRHDFSQAAYRDTTPGPSWSWQRFGRTSTPLPDGRVIHIAGEHEDSYDPDFCIYNDVVAEYPDGRRELFLYPKDVFPPTDFHSATLIGHEILLIGSIGYRDMRRVGETQVLKLDTRTLHIEPVATTGEVPGWISKHIAEKRGEQAILVIGGNVQTPNGYEANLCVFELDLATFVWRRTKHGDLAVFSISETVYRQAKMPRYGKTNPERCDNPFWHEMVRRRWSPSRARLHFGDFAPPKPDLVLSGGGDLDTAMERSTLKRTIDDIVWTAGRQNALELTLADGRELLIGGEIPSWGDDYADIWIYNDVIVRHPDGSTEILAYPVEAFPHLLWFGGVDGIEVGNDVYIFGRIDQKRHPERSRGPIVLRLDKSSYEIADLAVAPPGAWVNIYAGCHVHDGNRVLFPIVQDHDSEPELYIAFDLDGLVWGEPFPYTPHA